MKRTIVLIICLFMLTSCSFESYIPEQNTSINDFSEFEELYRKSAEELLSYNIEAFVSHSSVYQHQYAKDLSGLYIVDIKNEKSESLKSINVSTLFNTCGVKMIDTLINGDKKICSFGFATPNHSFDWGYYYISDDNPYYLGDLSVDLEEKDDGFYYEYKISSMTSISYFTKKISDNFYYYEIK